MAEIVQEEFLLRGMEVVLGARANRLEKTEDGVVLETEDGRDFTGTNALICMGMRAEIAGLGLEKVGVETTQRGEIVIDDHCRTTNPRISAGGDVTGGWMLASTAAMQGRISALSVLGHNIDGDEPRRDRGHGVHVARGRRRRADRDEGEARQPRRGGHPARHAQQSARPDRRPEPGHDQAHLGPRRAARCSAARSSATARRS